MRFFDQLRNRKQQASTSSRKADELAISSDLSEDELRTVATQQGMLEVEQESYVEEQADADFQRYAPFKFQRPFTYQDPNFSGKSATATNAQAPFASNASSRAEFERIVNAQVSSDNFVRQVEPQPAVSYYEQQPVEAYLKQQSAETYYEPQHVDAYPNQRSTEDYLEPQAVESYQQAQTSTNQEQLSAREHDLAMDRELLHTMQRAFQNEQGYAPFKFKRPFTYQDPNASVQAENDALVVASQEAVRDEVNQQTSVQYYEDSQESFVADTQNTATLEQSLDNTEAYAVEQNEAALEQNFAENAKATNLESASLDYANAEASSVDASSQPQFHVLSEMQALNEFEMEGTEGFSARDNLAVDNLSVQNTMSFVADKGINPSLSEQEQAAQLIANMMLKNNPLANLTADTNSELEQDNALGFNTKVVSQDGSEYVVTDDAQASALSENGFNSDSDSQYNLTSITFVEEDEEEADDNCRVKNSIKEPMHKIEVLDSNDSFRMMFLDEHLEQKVAKAESREDALVQAFVGPLDSSSGNTNPPAFTLLQAHNQSSISDVYEKEKEKHLLSAELNTKGNQADINDFVTGNIITLRTGTDNISVAASAAASSDQAFDNADDTLEQPSNKVKYILTDPEELKKLAPNLAKIKSYANLNGMDNHHKLIPTLFGDFVRYFYVYTLACLLGVLCLFKVYQVQETRELNSQLNEVTINNEALEKEWLGLVAARQDLSEHSKVRSFATRQLEMVSPKTESEYVISLH